MGKEKEQNRIQLKGSRLIGPPPVQWARAGTDSTQEVTIVDKNPLFPPANGGAADEKSLSTTTRPVRPHTPTMGSETIK
jgi:hypothetical protein